MDFPGTNSVARSLDAASIPRDRRCRPRLKVHTPAYASFNGGVGGMVLDLSEILDINEDGMAIQTTSALEVNQSFNLCLDLSETKTYVYTPGSVVWCGRSGRAGIRFPGLPESSRRPLREWLFVNTMVACARQAAKTAAAAPVAAEPAAPADHAAVLAALAAAAREVDTLGPDLDRALQLISSHAQAFTPASGAAIALSGPQGMVCRASAGADAPSLGARFQVGSGFSGECVRTGRLLRCNDAETDPRVDRESCRLLGIRSMIAAPVRLGETVIGLLEVFSPYPGAFGENDSVVLQRLVEIILAAVHRAGRYQTPPRLEGSPETAQPEAVSELTVEERSVSPSEDVGGGLRLTLPRSHLLLLIAVAATIALALGFLLAPWIQSRLPRTASPQAQPASQSRPAAPATAMGKAVAGATTLGELHKLAEQGNPAAQFAMGARYATGDEVSQDYTQAVRWFSQAAEQGHVVAQATLGAYYWAGRGVPQDVGKAYFWSILARAGGDEASKYRVAVLTSRLTRVQILSIQQQADDWLKQHQSAGQPSSAP